MISRITNLLSLRNYNFAYYNPEQKRYMSGRTEQNKLRNYLEKNKDKKCIICQKHLPPYTLECAHIKPRMFCSIQERHDFNVVNWMCRNCHIIFDRGGIGIKDGEILISDDLKQFSDFSTNFNTENFYTSPDYFRYHFNNIFKK
jgi:predicted restriction endonuclease